MKLSLLKFKYHDFTTLIVDYSALWLVGQTGLMARVGLMGLKHGEWG